MVTGGASGLGEATARALAAKGAKVAIFDLQGGQGRSVVAAEIGGVFCAVNVTSDESVDAGFARARAAHGQERILVNCAGTGNAIKTASRSREDGSDQRIIRSTHSTASSRSTWSAVSDASPSRPRAC